MAEHSASIPDDRPLSDAERKLLRFLLSNAERRGQSFLHQVDEARVAARCRCGCASVDLSINGKISLGTGLEPISRDYYWNTESGGLCAVFAFAKDDQLAGLEVYSVDGADIPGTLPPLDNLYGGREGGVATWSRTRRPMRLLTKVGIGMGAGAVGPFALGYIPSSGAELRLLLLFGPVFGGAMAYFLHRLHRVHRRHGEYPWVVLSGALAGGATAGIAFDFGYLSSPWHVAAGAAFGALAVACFWVQGSWGRS